MKRLDRFCTYTCMLVTVGSYIYPTDGQFSSSAGGGKLRRCREKLSNDDVISRSLQPDKSSSICFLWTLEHLSNSQTHFADICTAAALLPRASSMLIDNFKVDSPNVQYESDAIAATYNYDHTDLSQGRDGRWNVRPKSTQYEFRTSTRVPKLG